MSIGFVIVTYESERVLPACLASIPKGHEIAVVDNASKDSSAEIAHTFGARLIVNRSNLGFGAACNQGAKLLSSSHVFFLNPDATLDESTIPELEKAMALWPDAGGFGPAIGIPGKRQKFRSVSFPESRGRGFAQEVAPNGSAEAGFLDGAALVVDLKLYWELSGFDERIFLYYEDDDLCFRIRERSKKLIFVPSARVTHARNESSGSSLYLDYFRSFHAAKSKIFICNKYGIPYKLGYEKRHAYILLLRSLASLNVRKAAKSLGALSAWRSAQTAQQAGSAQPCRTEYRK